MRHLTHQPPQPPKKEGISLFDWKTRAAGDRSCICTPQSHDRDCDAVGISTDSIPVRGIRAEAFSASPASPFPELIPATLSSSIGTSAAVSHSRMFAGYAGGRGERDWLGAVQSPRARRRDL